MSGEGEKAVQQDPLVVEINEVKDDIKELKKKIKAFDDDPSPKDEFAKQCYLEDKRRLTGLETRLTGLETDLRTLRAQLTPQPQVENSSQAPELLKLIEELQNLKILSQQKRDADSYSYVPSMVSFSEIGRIQLDLLEKRNARTKFRAISRSEAVISVTDQKKLLLPQVGKTWSKKQKKQVKTESFLCMKMTKYLKRLFVNEDEILVNSEELKWIVTLTQHEENFMKPDFFVTRKGLQSSHAQTGPEFIRKARLLESTTFEFGTLCDWRVRDCISAIIEFKVKLVPEDFGKLVCYLQHLCRDDPSSTYYGMVCDREDIWLTSCTRGEANVRVDLKWTNEGSVDLIRNFFSKRNSWRILLDYCCKTLFVKLAESDAFLGSGAYGRAFKVVGADGIHRALKIVYSTDPLVISVANAEVNTMKNIKAQGGNCATIETAIALCDPRSGMTVGIGYVMTEVGTQLSSQNCRSSASSARKVFKALHSLHQLRRYHGDPRLPNLIEFNDRLIWIDFMRGTIGALYVEEFHLLVVHDFKILFKSIYETNPNDVTTSFLEKYANSLTDTDFESLLSSFIRS